MKTTKLPLSAWNDAQAAGSQSQSVKQPESYYPTCDKKKQTGRASNDDIYKNLFSKNMVDNVSIDKMSANIVFTNKGVVADAAAQSAKTQSTMSTAYKKAPSKESLNRKVSEQIEVASTTFKNPLSSESHSNEHLLKDRVANKASNLVQPSSNTNKHMKSLNLDTEKDELNSANINAQIPERVFMNGLIKHTAIALAIIIPLAAFSAYAAPQNMPMTATPEGSAIKSTQMNSTEMPVIEPSSIIHKSANMPTTVDSVDLEQYAGTWYEIGRLPMYFQRKCASDVTATYTGKADGSGIDVLNQCRKEDGAMMSASGLAKAVDNSGSKLKVTFLPSWIRWLPVGRADYWVLARDANYQTALVGTPDKKYLWLLARTPNISQQTYSKYRQIAQQQGFDLREFKLTTQSNQHVKLVP